MDSTTLVLALCVLIFTFLWLKWAYAVNPPLPPGPKGYPIIGNVYDVPSSMPWISFQKMAKIYGMYFVLNYLDRTERILGDIMYLKVPMQEFVVLDSAEAAFDLLEKRSEIYSDRPHFIMHKL